MLDATDPQMHSLTHSTNLPSGPTPICISFSSLLLIDRWLHAPPVVVVVVVVVQLGPKLLLLLLLPTAEFFSSPVQLLDQLAFHDLVVHVLQLYDI